MKDRIRQIMESQHMTQQVFADYIGQSPATLSSIFNGRTRPTINIVEAIKKKIPNINTDWLMFGLGDMYRTESEADSASPTPVDNGSDQHAFNPNPMLDFDTPQSLPSQNPPSGTQIMNGLKSTRPEIVREEVKFIDKPQRKVIEIRVFYDDQTWDTVLPAKK